MSKAKVLDIEHPVIDRYLTILRDKNSGVRDFRVAMGNIATILAYHALSDLKTSPKTIETPIQETTGYDFGEEVFIIPILRAGLSLQSGILQFIPDAKVGHIGVYRDEETHQPVNYYHNLPNGIEDAYTLVIDPMLATGGSAIHTINFLKENGAQKICFLCLLAAPEGIEKLQEAHPDVKIITAAIDDHLNENAYIVPGLGDAGDRYFGTT